VDEIRLRPHAYLLRRGWGSALAFFVPASVALYFLAVPVGTWPLVCVAQVLFIGVFLLALRAFLRVGIWVSPTSVTEQGFFTRTHLKKGELGEAIFVNTFHGGWIDTVPQLFLCDHNGKQVLRMRGEFWSRESMMTVASTLELPFTEIGRDVSMAELHEAYPGLLYWFERRPVLAGALAVSAALIVVVAIYLVLRALGVVG
jgi:hypothetical protein